MIIVIRLAFIFVWRQFRVLSYVCLRLPFIDVRIKRSWIAAQVCFTCFTCIASRGWVAPHRIRENSLCQLPMQKIVPRTKPIIFFPKGCLRMGTIVRALRTHTVQLRHTGPRHVVNLMTSFSDFAVGVLNVELESCKFACTL